MYHLMGSIYGTKGLNALSLKYYNNALKIRSEIKDSAGMAETYGNLGITYNSISSYDTALVYYNKAVQLEKALGRKKELMVNLGNMGVVYMEKGDYPKALRYYFKALKTAEETKDKRLIAGWNANIGIVFMQQGDYDKALSYYFKSMNIAKAINHSAMLAKVYGNIGVAYDYKENYEEALRYYNKALEIDRKAGNHNSIARQLANMSVIYINREDYSRALTYLDEASKINAITRDLKMEINILNNYATIYISTKEFDKAEAALKRALQLSFEIHSLDDKRVCYELLSSLHKEKGNWKEALEHYSTSIAYKDSIFNTDKSAVIGKIIAEAEHEKQAAVIKERHKKELEKKNALAEEERKRNEVVFYFILSVAFAVGAIAIIILRSLYFTRKQKKIIEEQKTLVEEKQKEVIDSINYAKRIQNAILAHEDDISRHLAQSFLLYMPKDIVAGDFYFFETTATHIFYAAADCTGHGVPGALVSVVCSNALTRCVKEFGLTDPGEILDKARELVLDTFKKSNEEVKDGMDISLCSIEIKNLQGSQIKIKWAGANNPLWYTKQGTMKEIKPNKQPIGLAEKPAPFTTHEIILSKNDMIFLFTDGYADQFGGDKGKKFKYASLQQILAQLHQENPDMIKTKLHQAFNEWKGALEQIDDVLVIGVKL